MRTSSVATMLEARTVAVVGASARPDSIGEQIMIQLTTGGFDGGIYPVNPRYEEVLGHRCYPSLAEVPESVDLVILGVANARLEEQLQAAATAAARSAVIFASCYEAPAEGRPPLGERLAAIARSAGMSLCGGNGMGFVNVERRLRACGFSEPPGLAPGPITFISHSGSAFSAMLHNDRGLRFNLAVSSGLELVTTAAEYVEYALEQRSTGALALFIETAREPDRFRAALAAASERDVPVVVLKVGRENRAKELVEAHSGALAGEDAAYDALFDAYGVLRVETLDEMADTLELLCAGRRAGPGGLAAIHDSGGERAHLIDASARTGIRLAQISEQTTARLVDVLEEGLPPVNPLDAWGTGNDADEIFIASMHALLDDPDTAALAFCVDLTTELISETGYTRVAREVFAKTEKPVAVLSNMASAIDQRDAGFVREAGIPVLEGTTTGLLAFKHLLEYRDYQARPPVAPPPGGPADRWRGRLREGAALSSVEAFALLGDYGIPVARTEGAASAEEAVDAAERIGWPVALKTAAAEALHKTEAGGVRLGIQDEEGLRAAYLDLSGRLGPNVVVQSTALPGVEVALGVARDEQFGPMVMAAAGGTLVEVLRDRRFALPPIDPARARALIDRLAIRPLLDGVRGAPPADIDAVAEALVRLSVLAQELGDLVAAIDVNPVIVGPQECVAVDALVIQRGA